MDWKRRNPLNEKHSHGTEKLKAFIHAFVTFIDSDLAYEEALEFIKL